MMKRMILLLLCALMMNCAAAEMSVTFPDMHYGDEAFQMHLRDEVNKLIFQGEEYLLEDDRFHFDEAMIIYGGKTRAVYEMTLPLGSYSLQPTEQAMTLGTVVIDIPHKATLYVGTGNRRSGEYTLQSPITLTDVYREEITLPRSADGAPLLIDQVYLYSYERDGETIRRAATLFIDYEDFAAGYTGASTAETAMPTEAPVIVSAVTVNPLLLAAPAVIALLAIILFSATKKPKPKALPAEEPQESDFASQASALMERLQQESDQLADDEISSKVDALLQICRHITRTAAEQPAKATSCRKFLSYYLPTTIKMITSCRSITQSGVSSAEVDKVRASTLKGLEMIIAACQNLLDSLFGGDVQDISLDVEILEKMLKRDGLIENELDLAKLIPPGK